MGFGKRTMWPFQTPEKRSETASSLSETMKGDLLNTLCWVLVKADRVSFFKRGLEREPCDHSKSKKKVQNPIHFGEALKGPSLNALYRVSTKADRDSTFLMEFSKRTM